MAVRGGESLDATVNRFIAPDARAFHAFLTLVLQSEGAFDDESIKVVESLSSCSEAIIDSQISFEHNEYKVVRNRYQPATRSPHPQHQTYAELLRRNTAMIGVTIQDPLTRIETANYAVVPAKALRARGVGEILATALTAEDPADTIFIAKLDESGPIRVKASSQAPELVTLISKKYNSI